MQYLTCDCWPGPDDLTANFYKYFLEHIKALLFETLKEAKNNLSLTLRQGVIVLIPKPDKDRKIRDNWIPITLLNNDYKLLTYIFSIISLK